MTSNELLDKETYPYSMGTGAVMKTIEELMTTANNNYDTLFINIESLIRNNYEKDIQASALFKLVDDELHDVIRDVAAHMSRCVSIKQPSILIYTADPNNKLPIELCKKPTIRRITTSVVNKMFYRQFKLQKIPILIDGIITQRVAFDPNIWPHFQIKEYLRKQKNSKTCLLLSHIAIDFHVLQWFPSLRIIESYTGKLIASKELPNKVFKNQVIPFNMYTHVLIGSKELIRSPIKIKEKKRLLQIANDENWILRSDNYVRNSIKKNNFKILVDLNKRR